MATVVAHFTSKTPSILFDGLMNPAPISLPGVGTTYHSYLNVLLDAYVTVDSMVASEINGGRYLADYLDAQGIWRLETVGFNVAVTPAFQGAFSLSGSTVRNLTYESKIDGSEISIDGLLSYRGLPFVSQLMAGSTINTVTAGVPSHPVLGGIPVVSVLDVGITYSTYGWYGSISGLVELIADPVTFRSSGVGLSTNLQVTPSATTLFDAQIGSINELALVELDERQALVNSVVISDFSVASASLPLALPQQTLLAGDDTAWMTGNGMTFLNLYSGDDLVFAGTGAAFLDGGPGTDTAAFAKTASQYRLAYSDGAWLVSDRSGVAGDHYLGNFETVRFADKSVFIEARTHGGYSDLPEALWHFFIVAFDAAPGVEYMNQLAEAHRFGFSVPQIVEIFTSKPEFSAVYPEYFGTRELAEAMVANIVKESASLPARQEAVADIQGALELGWSVGHVIYTVFGNLANKSFGDSSWGNTARQFQNQIDVARYYTEVMDQSTTDLGTLRAVIDSVTPWTDVSSEQALITLIGAALIDG